MKNKKYIVWGLLVISIVFFFMMNVIVPYFSDDYGFMYLSPDRKIATFWEAICKTGSFYMEWNGRIYPNLLGFSLMSLVSDPVFNVLNTLVYIAFLFLTIRYLFGSFYKAGIVGISTLLVGLFLINSNDLFYWAIGACNYLWPLPLFMCLLILVEKTQNKETRLPSLALFIIAFLLSLTHEVFIMPLCGALGLLFLYDAIKTKKVNWKFFFLLAGIASALCVVLFSPGVISKFGDKTEATGSFLVYVAKLLIKVLFELRLFYLMVIGLVVLRCKRREHYRQFIKDNAILLLMAVMGLIPAIAVSSGGRVLICAELASLFVLVRLIQFEFDTKNVRITALSLYTVLVGVMFFVAYHSYYNWEAYRGSEKDYFSQEGETVIIDDSHNYAAYILPGYIMNLDKVYEACVKSRLSTEKKYLNRIDSCGHIAPLPLSVGSLLKEPIETFKESNKVSGDAGFYAIEGCHFYIAKYSDKLADAIFDGRLSFKYSLPFIKGKNIIVNIAAEEAKETSMPTRIVLCGLDDKYILFPSDYKTYPFTFLEEIILLDTPSASRFVIQ